MLENINLKDFPKRSGVYWILDENNVVVYVGSSCNLHQRINEHRSCINKGSKAGRQKDFYQFLQSNQFQVEFQLTDDYRQLEQELIEKYNPKYNTYRATTGLATYKGRRAEYDKDYYQKFKEEKRQYKKRYNHQLCSYNGEILSFCALSMRFRTKGILNPTQEAKKYLI